MKQRALAGHRAIDVSDLQDQGAFGHSGLIWWGTTGYMVIEGAMLVMVVITYFYLRLRVKEWPPGLPNPDLLYGTINLVLMLASVVPNHLAKSAAERFDLRRVRLWLVVSVLFGIAFMVVRTLEFTTLNCRWDSNAYGSMVWCVMVLHTIHVATDVVDTGVLTAVAFFRPVTKKRFIDISENGLYWDFIVLWLIPIYLTIYFAPRWL